MIRFSLPEGHDEQPIEAFLTGDFAFAVEEPVVQQRALYDTFDWRLFSRSLTLFHAGHELALRRLSDGERLQSLTTASPPAFVWDLSDGPLREQLEPIVEIRALLLLAEIRTRSRTYRLLNADEKTIARLVYTQARFGADNSVPVTGAYLTLLPVRGYPKHARRLAKQLREAGLTPAAWIDVYFAALEAAGKRPGSYTSKPDFQLEPGERSDLATKMILHQLLGVMRANQAGIRADIDTEFLHDFRVAIRRTRSALSQIRNVFPPQTTERFRGEFRHLGSLTNQLRDLDVYLLSESAYRAQLPDPIRQDIGPLFDYFRAQREQALQDVVVGLDSAEYARILRDWEVFLNQPVPETPEATNAAMPIIELARQRIYRRYRRVVKDGNYALDHTQDELLHALRIECKKLRYLLEVFASLFPPKKVARLINQLKRLQDNLGEFNDLSVQQAYLLGIAEELPVSDTQTRRALVATGFLVESLARRQQVVKAGFAQTFTDFASTGNQRLYGELFAHKGKGSAS
jgi:CHAD domain-containing protein